MKFNFKNLCLVMLFFTIYPLYAANDVVKNIKIEGLVNFNQSIVRDKIEIKKNQKINQEQVNNDIKAILSTGYFFDAEAKTEDVKGGINLIYQVKEKMMIKTIKFEGNKKIKAGKIKEKIGLKEKGFYDDFGLGKAKEEIIDFYKEQGYGDASLDTVVDVDKTTNKVDITVFLTEGNILKLKNIIITGNKELKTKHIFKILGMKRKKVFKEDEYKKGLEQVELLYKENGFLDISIVETLRTFDKNRENIEITLEIKEVAKYKINEISFVGNKVFLPSELTPAVSLKKGIVFKQSIFDESIMNIQTLYAERGYIRAIVKPEITYKENAVNIKFVISESNIIYIDKIYIDGNDITRDYVILREIVIKEQEVFNVSKVRRTQERIFNLGFFKDVQMDLEPIDDNTVDLTFKVEEQPTGMATVGAGYSSEDGLIGNLQFTKNNLFGRGQRLNFLWEFGNRKQNYQIGFTEPYLFGSYTSFGADIFDMGRALDYIYNDDDGVERTDTYHEQHQGLSFRFGKKFWEDYSASATFGFEKYKIYDVDDNDTSSEHQTLLEEQAKGEQQTNSITFGIARDTRDNVFYTKRGTYTRLSAKNAGGILQGDNDFVKTLLNHSRFYPLFWEFVLALNVDAGIVTPYGYSSNVPLTERFYIGGSESVRGYNYKGDIGPEDGGLYKLVYNIEYKFPIVQEKKQSILQGALFFDVGGAWDKGEEVTLKIGRDENQMRCGFGLGIRFTTPAFPIRLDWGYGLNKEDGKTPSKFYFTIGQLF